MNEYIYREVQLDDGGYIEQEKELIRCKDCRNFLENWRCLKWSAFARPEGYCYKAERKKYEEG